jgi:uncharacterized membrane protein YkvI
MIARSRFQRFVLPGLAFKAVVIGGGYATGRELAEFFLPSGPIGGALGIVLAMFAWSGICVLTFLFSWMTAAKDYTTFFRHLLGRFGFVYEMLYFAFIVLVLAIFGAAAGEIGHAVAGWPSLAGTLTLMVGIAVFSAFGNESVERLFKYVSFFLYLVYAAFAALALYRFGDRILLSFKSASLPAGTGWAIGGATYAAYNVMAAVVILPVLRHLTSRRDAIVAGALCGPLAIIPALLFFMCMVGFHPQIGAEALPSNFLLEQIHLRSFQVLFQLMIFAALLESGTGSVHAVNERIAGAIARSGRTISDTARFGVAATLLFVSIFIADRFGLVALIAKGYRGLAWAVMVVFVVPLATYGAWLVLKQGGSPRTPASHEPGLAQHG